MSQDKSGSPPCGIYVRIDDYSNMLDLIGYIRQLAFAINRASGYEKNLVVVEVAFDPENPERHADILPVIRSQGVVAIVSGKIDPTLEADGALVDDVSSYAEARAALGEDAIIGIVCDDRSACEKAKATDADYVVLNADPALVSWWASQSDMMNVVRAKKGITPDNCGAVVRSGAGFVDVSDYILKHKKGIMQGTVNILHEIDLATQTPKQLN